MSFPKYLRNIVKLKQLQIGDFFLIKLNFEKLVIKMSETLFFSRAPLKF